MDKMSPKCKSSPPPIQSKINCDNAKNKISNNSKDCAILNDFSKSVSQNSKPRKNKKKRNQNLSLTENPEPMQTKHILSETTSQAPVFLNCTKNDSPKTVSSKDVKETCNRIDKSNLKYYYDLNFEVKVDITWMLSYMISNDPTLSLKKKF